MDKFTQAFFAAALWSSSDENDVPLDQNYDEDDFSPEATKQLTQDCAEFQRQYSYLFTEKQCLKFDDSPVSHAGHDFWLTRNGHGAGFWEKSDWKEKAGKILTDASKKFGEVDIYVGDDGKLHI